VLLNVLMSKKVTDWFAGREIATAMAVFVNSWPAGIAVALLVLPPIGAAYGVSAAFLVAVVLVAIGMIMLAALYKHPSPSTAGSSAKVKPDRLTTSAVLVAGLIWTLYNTAFGMIFSFGPSMLVERGWPITAAGSTVSLVLWLAVLSVPFGGLIAGRTKRAYAILVVSCLAFAALLVLASRTDATVPAFVALGLVCGLPAGPNWQSKAVQAPVLLGVYPSVGARQACCQLRRFRTGRRRSSRKNEPKE
jgi:hypothetical protein